MSEEIISYAKSLGVYTIVADNYPPEKSPAKLIADEAWDISLEEMDELERMCREQQAFIIRLKVGTSIYGGMTF